jgi:hypothetical protein
MTGKFCRLWFVLCALAMSAVCVGPARAQMNDVHEKPRMYSYVAYWAYPRAQWGDVAKMQADDRKILDKGIADGKIIGYGDDMNLVHQPDGTTHDDWFSSMSMGGLLDVLDQFYKSPDVTSPVEASATKHFDEILVSRYYNIRSGNFKGGYTYVAEYALKPDAPDDAVDVLSKNLVVPVLEKLFADGTLNEYEIDTRAIHTEAPGTFFIVYLAASADGIDKVNAAIRDAVKSNALSGPAFDAMTDFTGHRDYLSRTDAMYK